jgi:hypothetical protein
MISSRPIIVLLAALALAASAQGCATRKVLIEVSGAVLYEKPKIERVTHQLVDRRAAGGRAVLEIAMWGDPGLAASFDILPGVAERAPMKESADGAYSGAFAFEEDTLGGPYTLIVRLRHDAAGEATWRETELITIPLQDEEFEEEP